MQMRCTVKQNVISTEEEVKLFLSELKAIISHPDFKVDSDLDILFIKKNEVATDPYTTVNTLLSLDFDRADVVHQLMSLETEDYMETIIDDKDQSLPPFYAFTRTISCRDVYIKVKIRDSIKRKVFCVSFHFARFPIRIDLPYK